MARDLVVIGAGGFGRETLDVIEAWNLSGSGEPFNVLGVIDDSPSEQNLQRLAVRGYTHLGGIAILRDIPAETMYLVAVGNPQLRAKIVSQCNRLNLSAAAVVDPSAKIGSQTQISEGVIICGGVKVSTNVSIGRHAHFNPGCIIGHDTIIGDFVSVNPGAILSGDLTVQNQVLIGAGAVVLQGLGIGTSSTIGASACVVKDVGSFTTVRGVPAK